MPGDAWADLNRRAAAVAGGMPLLHGMQGRCGKTDKASLGFIIRPPRRQKPSIQCTWGSAREMSAKQRREFRPDLSYAGTRGILRAALGSPSMEMRELAHGEHQCLISADDGTCLTIGRGSTREQAEADALVVLAEARKQWGPG